MSLEIGINTVIILVGPSQSGKSTWSKQFQRKVKDKDPELRTTILSSDEIRRELLGEDYHRYDTKMLEASEAAFELLFAKLKAAIRYPINNEFVIVDTTGLDPDFRRKVTDTAKENGYRTCIVMFDYSTSDYFSGLSSQEKAIVSKHVDTFKKRTLPGIKRKHYDYSFTIKAKNEKFFDKMEIDIVDYPIWRKSNLTEFNFDKNRPLAIIGDIHEHIVALDMLLQRVPENAQLIFVGDLVDKGGNTKEIIEMIEPLVAKGAIMVVGNHEAFVARRLRGEIDAINNEDELFPSLKVFKKDKALAERFLKLYDLMLPFACVRTHGKTIYITHAPCYNKSLGKLDERNRKFQRNFYFASRDNDSMMEELQFIIDEAKNTHPYHVFGHVAHKLKDVEFKNKIWLDTGAVYGGKLSAFVVYPNGVTKVVSQSVPPLTEGNLLYFSKKKSEKPLEGLEQAKERLANRGTTATPDKIALFENEVEISGDNNKESNKDLIDSLSEKYKLTPEDKYWLHSFSESGAKFISGTMSPSRSTKTVLEPINSALQYFKSKGVDKIIIEPKFMGSRLQVYLHRDKTKDFAITRSGIKSSHQKELEIVFQQLHEQWDNKEWKEQIIFDGELLPWSAIGQELIEKEFLQYGTSIEKELNLLAQDEVAKEFQDILGLCIEDHNNEIAIFLEQLKLYGSKEPISYRPFSILSMDSKNYQYENQLMFTQLLPEEQYLVVNLNDNNAIENAENFFNNLTNNADFSHEGVVIKPLIYKEGVAPYMKVRNEKYLHLIYGYDYQFNYQKMVDNKSINRKLELSMKEYELGMKMLEAQTKEELLDLACKMKCNISNEKELDSRL